MTLVFVALSLQFPKTRKGILVSIFYSVCITVADELVPIAVTVEDFLEAGVRLDRCVTITHSYVTLHASL